jgi:hypothetical protein
MAPLGPRPDQLPDTGGWEARHTLGGRPWRTQGSEKCLAGRAV